MRVAILLLALWSVPALSAELYFAEIDTTTKVVKQIIVVNSDAIGTATYPASEAAGVAFLTQLYGAGKVWKQTSYTSGFKKNPAARGGTYDSTKDAFIDIKPYPSWVLDAKTAKWVAPVPYPKDGLAYIWDEPSLSWVKVPSK